MAIAYVDTSCLISIEFGEADSAAVSKRLNSFNQLISSNLLEAQFLAAFVRYAREPDRGNLARIRWVHPDRALQPEITKVLAEGYVRGADCWHLANALYFAAHEPSSISFLTLDRRQRTVARALGFGV